jgi:hypothetical protein
MRANSDSKLSRMAGEVQQSYPVWQEKFVMARVLFMYPVQREKLRVALMLS